MAEEEYTEQPDYFHKHIRKPSGKYEVFPDISTLPEDYTEEVSPALKAFREEEKRRASGLYGHFDDISTMSKLFKGSGISHKTWMIVMYVFIVVLLIALFVMIVMYIHKRKQENECKQAIMHCRENN